MESVQSFPITKCNQNVIEGAIAYDNFNRARKLAIILFWVNFVFLFIDYQYMVNGLWRINEEYRNLFYAHIYLGLVSFGYILTSCRVRPRSANEITQSHKLYPIIFVFLLQGLTVIISGWITQKMNGQSTVYLIACLTFAVLFNYRPKIAAFFYGLSYLAFTLLLIIAQQDQDVRLGYFMDASLLVLISYYLSTLLYKCKWQDLNHKYNLEDLVKERTQELRGANISLLQEISERKRTEKEMARLDRLNLVGEMAAGIGHEIRNPMTTVRGYLQLFSHKEEFTQYQSQLALMIAELDKANSIITEFLSLAKDRVVNLKVQSLQEIVQSILPFIQADGLISDQNINLDLAEVEEIPLDRKEIQQLILNLVLNGSQAMSPGGTLLIRTFMNDDEIVLSVEDNGPGISQDVIEKIGTPFFTTKENGTGLGVAICYSIAVRHNAQIDIKTGSTGTIFYVRFKKKLTGLNSLN